MKIQLKDGSYKEFLNLWKEGDGMVETHGHSKWVTLKNKKI